MQFSLGNFTLLLTASLPFTTLARSIKKDCKCTPSDACWPSEEEWHHFNKSIGGILVDVNPVAEPCYKDSPEYDEARCDEVTKMFHDSRWRTDQADLCPGNESCYLPSVLPPSPPPVCKQGRVPLYGVPAKSAKDISKTVKFAAKHNIPLVIKNSGHDYLGRSSRRNALMIWTHFMSSIEYLNEDGGWTPEGCKGGKGREYKEDDLLIKAAAGVMLYDLYQSVGKRGRTVVAGAAGTVGVAGGYIQGGGHSALGPWKGMAIDHLVEVEVVVADGRVLKASPCVNTDLFWALRGGGGGTFGVVTSVTLRTHEDPPTIIYSVNATIPFGSSNDTTSADNKLWQLASEWHALGPAIDDRGGSGYYYFFPNMPGLNGKMFISGLIFIGATNLTEIEELFSPFVNWAYDNIGGPETGLVAKLGIELPKMSSFFNSVPPTDSTSGGNSLLGSRLVSKELLSTREGVEKTSEAMRKGSKLGVVLGHYVAGKGAAANKHIDSALHPAWRKTLTHIVFATGWDDGASFEYQESIKRMLTEQAVPALKELDWDPVKKRQTMGAYINEADKEEKNWQDSFWGDNYPRLRKLKQKWDPKGVFWCRPCVGSEDWDREGVCKV
ncbi:hypothetical protein BDZ91DRAFT_773355 [Kalaharituber pfeilii]|nr:hypothetical protein BDZ91DRAFT_773355 [Kalaharituber pfeilii]